MRHVEESIAELWRAGEISGEMHLGAGEEATIAGVVSQLQDGDALSVDYRSTPPFVARGVDLVSLFQEVLGEEAGLDGGRGGHMHLFSREHLAATSGIVGGPAPLACGFALAAQQRRTDRVAVAFFGDGAVNEGMVMESLNLAVVWRLPVVFVCKDNRWAVTTRSRSVLAGGLVARARGFGLPVRKVDGRNALAVWRAAHEAVERARRGRGPTFLVARVERIEGHFLGDPLVRVATDVRALAAEVGPLLGAVARGDGAGKATRARSLASLTGTIAAAAFGPLRPRRDPLPQLRRRLPAALAAELDGEARAYVAAALRQARGQAVAHG
jgi:pyruvate dehydrogenase E1 component alpha subunit